MKILHVYKDYPPVLGGIENHVRALAEAQAAQGHKVTVLVTAPGLGSRRGIQNGVEVIKVGRVGTVASTPISFGFPWALARRSPDITHLHFPYPVGEISQLLFGRDRPYVITYHSDVLNPKQQVILRLYNPILRLVLLRARKILATSPNYIATSPYLKRLAGRCVVVPLGVDPAPFLSASPLIPKDRLPTVLFVGRHRYYKGLGDLIQVMPGLQARLLVGGDGPMRPAWEKLAQRLGVTDRVLFLGDVPEADLPGLYASADLFVLPANRRAEAFGTVLLEAMASGLPCVATELGTGTSFVVQQGVTGLLVPPEDPAALAGAVGRLLADEGLRRAMGRAGRERVSREFALPRMVARVSEVYGEVLARSGADRKESARVHFGDLR